MADERRDLYDAVPRTLGREHHSDYRSAYLETYRALVSFANTHPANDNFCRCWPSVDKVAARAGQSRRTVFDSLAWLRQHEYVLVEQRGRHTSRYTLVLRREQFLRTTETAGRAAAIEEYEAWLAGQQEEAQALVAAARFSRDETPRRTRAAGPMCEPSHPSCPDRSPDVRTVAPQGCEPSHGASRRTQNDLKRGSEERDPGNEHSVAVAPEPPSPSPQTSTEDQTREPGWFRRELRRVAEAKRMPGA